jgi:uncharacterized protein YjiS (DUF1127 family)
MAIARLMLGLVWLWRERTRSRRELAAMSERQLQDIGVRRADIAEDLGKPFWRRGRYDRR